MKFIIPYLQVEVKFIINSIRQFGEIHGTI
jgi:hypothetical protein